MPVTVPQRVPWVSIILCFRLLSVIGFPLDSCHLSDPRSEIHYRKKLKIKSDYNFVLISISFLFSFSFFLRFDGTRIKFGRNGFLSEWLSMELFDAIVQSLRISIHNMHMIVHASPKRIKGRSHKRLNPIWFAFRLCSADSHQSSSVLEYNHLLALSQTEKYPKRPSKNKRE